MGIADLWPILNPVSDGRVPFPVFLSSFIAEHGRPPRLAIDAYMFMFWSQVPGSELDPNLQRRVIRNFLAKLWYLVQNTVLFVVVFDGKYKPGKLRNGHIPGITGSMSYDELLRYFQNIPISTYPEGVDLVETLKRIFQRNRIDWVQAPAEAEAECAWLQRLGIVDYVVSDDSDTMVFGATKMLRMFNRVKYYNDDNEPVLSSTDYYVTPVDMDHVVERTGLTRERLVFIAVLRGGDYSSGTESIGITRAKEIALCGTTMLLHLPRKTLQDFGSLPDFSRMFAETFVDAEKLKEHLASPYYGLKAELDRSEGLAAFNNFLDSFLRRDGKHVFGRLTTLKVKLEVDDYYALLYFFPLVNTRLFKFTPHSVSFGELNAIDSDLFANVSARFRRFNLNASGATLGELIVEKTPQKVTQIFVPADSCPEMSLQKYVLPRERKYNLKAFVTRLLREERYQKHITLARIKESEGVRMAVLKFQRLKLNELVYLRDPERKKELDEDNVNDAKRLGDDKVNDKVVEAENRSTKDDESKLQADEVIEVLVEEGEAFDSSAATQVKHELTQNEENLNEVNDPNSLIVETQEDEDKMLELTVPLAVLYLVAPEVVKEFERTLPKSSPRKKKPPPQKTTLDSIWPSMLPEKGNNVAKPLPVLSSTVRLSETSPTGPPKNSPRRRRRKNELLPGQSNVMSFFMANPFQSSEPLFVPSDEEDFIHMKNVVSGAPKLNPLKVKIESRLSSPEQSPSKRSRRKMSHDESPIKAERADSSAYPPL